MFFIFFLIFLHNLSLPTSSYASVVVSDEADKKQSREKAVRKRASPSTSSEEDKTADKHKKVKDRFLNLKNIIGEDILIDEEDEDDDDDEYDNEDGSEGDDTDSPEENKTQGASVSDLLVDETSNWTDFDIETLNFDKFIKDHQRINAGEPQSPSPSKNARLKSPSSGGSQASKRKKEEAASADPGELKAKRRRNRVLPIEIQGLMGEANLNYARGETNKAIDTCLEVIKYAPKASEPYQLLSLLYSEMGQNDKALRVGLIAAQLNKDADDWIQLIQQAVIEGDVELVLFCYNNAIQCNPKNIQLHIERVRLLKERKDMKKLFLARLMLLKYVDIVGNVSVYNEHFEQVMQELDTETDKQKKIYVLKNDMKKFQEKFSVESKEFLLYLFISRD